MSIVEIKIPSPGESITEVEIGSWLKADGDYVQLDETICEIETDKATLPLIAESSGRLKNSAAGRRNCGNRRCGMFD